MSNGFNCKITKLDKLANPTHWHNPFGFQNGESLDGHSMDYPVINKRFTVMMSKGSGFLSTSKVKSIYIRGSENDKLVIPSDFPDAKELDFSSVKLKNGEMLLATCNSIYMITDIVKDNNL
jgi:hypothetical protein